MKLVSWHVSKRETGRITVKELQKLKQPIPEEFTVPIPDPEAEINLAEKQAKKERKQHLQHLHEQASLNDDMGDAEALIQAAEARVIEELDLEWEEREARKALPSIEEEPESPQLPQEDFTGFIGIDDYNDETDESSERDSSIDYCYR